MRFVVTGAAGHVGRSVCDHLLAEGLEVVSLDRSAPTDGPQSARVDLAAGDLAKLFAPGDVVVHLAAIPSPGQVSDLDLFRNNTGATFNVLTSAARAGARLALVASSVSVYGLVWSDQRLLPPEVPLKESSTLQVSDAYALAKEVDEAIARMVWLKYQMPSICLRLPNVSDVADIRERSARVQGDPHYASRELWAYLDIADVGPLVVAAARAELSGAQVMNAVSPQPLGPVDLTDALREVYPEVSARPATAYDITALLRDIDFIPRHVL